MKTIYWDIVFLKVAISGICTFKNTILAVFLKRENSLSNLKSIKSILACMPFHVKLRGILYVEQVGMQNITCAMEWNIEPFILIFPCQTVQLVKVCFMDIVYWQMVVLGYKSVSWVNIKFKFSSEAGNINVFQFCFKFIKINSNKS